MFVYIVVTRSCTADYVTNDHCVDPISVTEDSVGATGDTWLCTCSSGDLCNKSSKTGYMNSCFDYCNCNQYYDFLCIVVNID